LVFVDLLNKKLYVTKDEGGSFVEHGVSFSPDHVVFHPTIEDRILVYSHDEHSVRCWRILYPGFRQVGTTQ